MIAGALLAGVTAYYVGAWLDFAALTLIDASLERVLLFSYPIIVVIARAVMDRRLPPPKLSMRPTQVLGAALIISGIIITVPLN